MDEYEKVLLRSIISSSSFDISIMGDVLSKLAYGTEYKDFTYHEAKNTTVKGRLVPTTTNVCMILNQLYKKDSYSDFLLKQYFTQKRILEILIEDTDYRMDNGSKERNVKSLIFNKAFS